MKRRGILHDALSGSLARLGHTDMVVVADCGLPRPAGVPIVDLALVFGIPTFAQVLAALAEEIVVERVTIARETASANPDAHVAIADHFGVPELVSHDGLKELSARAALVVRTGEATPYANAILHCGVPF